MSRFMPANFDVFGFIRCVVAVVTVITFFIFVLNLIILDWLGLINFTVVDHIAAGAMGVGGLILVNLIVRKFLP